MTSDFLKSQSILVSKIGDEKLIMAFLILALFLFLFINGYKLLSFLALLTTVSYPYSIILKLVYKTPRPLGFNTSAMSNWELFSYPSLHTSFYTAFLGFIIFLTFRFRKLPDLTSHIIRYTCVYLIGLVGFSRIYLNAHHLIDVFGGYLIGFGILGFIVVAELTLVKKSKL